MAWARPLKLQALNVGPQVQHLLLLSDFFLLERHLVGLLLHPPLLFTHTDSHVNTSPRFFFFFFSRFFPPPPHLALLLHCLFPRLPRLLALLLVAGLVGDAGQVRLVDPRHALRLLGGETSGGKDVQRDARLAGHADRLRLRTERKKKKTAHLHGDASRNQPEESERIPISI